MYGAADGWLVYWLFFTGRKSKERTHTEPENNKEKTLQNLNG